MSLTLEQKQSRLSGLGGSDAAAVVSLSPYKTAWQLFMEKSGQAPLGDEESEAMLWGSVLEEPVANEYARRTNRKIRRQPMMTSKANPFMLVNLDRQILGDPRGCGVLEIKCFGEWSGRGISTVDQLPDHVFLQVQHALAVTEYTWGSVAILVAGQKFVFFDVERNDAVIAELIRQEGEFWERVQTGNAPPVDGSVRTGEMIRRLYPRDTGKVLTIEAPALIRAAKDMAEAKAQVKREEAVIMASENMLRNAMGDASKAILPGFGEISWKNNKDGQREWVDLDLLKANFPDAYAAVFKREPKIGNRPFILKPTKE